MLVIVVGQKPRFVIWRSLQIRWFAGIFCVINATNHVAERRQKRRKRMNKYIITFRKFKKWCRLGGILADKGNCTKRKWYPISSMRKCTERNCPILKSLKKVEGQTVKEMLKILKKHGFDIEITGKKPPESLPGWKIEKEQP